MSASVKGFGCWPWRRSGQGAGPASESLQRRKPRGGWAVATLPRPMGIWRAARPGGEGVRLVASAELDQAVEAVGVEPDAQPALALQPAGERGSLPSTI